MSVCMDPHVHYRSSSVGKTPFAGKLTNARIRFWAKQGYYGSIEQKIALQVKAVRTHKTLTVNQLVNKYINL